MGSSAALYLRLVHAQVRSQLQYRVSFVLYLAGSFVLTITEFLGIWVIFHQLPTLRGWTLPEVAFLYGTSYVSFKCTDMVLGHLDTLPDLVRMGQLDTVLTRPAGSLFQVISSDFALRHLGSIAQGALILGWAIASLSIDWNLARLGSFVVMLVCGGLIFGSIWVVGASTVFWTGGNGSEVLNTFTYGGNQLSSYPIDIYAGWLRRLVAFIIPLGFVNYFPALYILDREAAFGSSTVLRFMSPFVAIVLVVIARQVWQLGIRNYRSTGS